MLFYYSNPANSFSQHRLTKDTESDKIHVKLIGFTKRWIPMAKDYKIALLLDFYGEILTDKQKDMVDLYYNEDMSLGEIAQNAGISRQGVRDSIKRAESILHDMEDKLSFMKRYNDLLEEVSKIKIHVEMINEDNEKYYYSPTIKREVLIVREEIDELLKSQ